MKRLKYFLTVACLLFSMMALSSTAVASFDTAYSGYLKDAPDDVKDYFTDTFSGVYSVEYFDREVVVFLDAGMAFWRSTDDLGSYWNRLSLIYCSVNDGAVTQFRVGFSQGYGGVPAYYSFFPSVGTVVVRNRNTGEAIYGIPYTRVNYSSSLLNDYLSKSFAPYSGLLENAPADVKDYFIDTFSGVYSVEYLDKEVVIFPDVGMAFWRFTDGSDPCWMRSSDVFCSINNNTPTQFWISFSSSLFGIPASYWFFPLAGTVEVLNRDTGEDVTAIPCTRVDYTPSLLDSYLSNSLYYECRDGHSWVESHRTSATCTAPGSVLFTCTRSGCNETKTETISALGHDYVSNRTEPTCTTPGSITSICSRCNDTITEELPVSYHSWDTVEMIPSVYDDNGNIVTEGYTFYTCSICGSHYTAIAGASPPAAGLVSDSLGGEGMPDTTAALGKTFLSGLWSLFAITVPGFSFTFGQMWLGVLLASISILAIRMIFGFGGGPRGESPRTSSTSNPRISKERRRDEL